MQDRTPPAYQEFASDMMARREYRAMSLPERGLLYTLRLECWTNQSLPSDPAQLAKILGLPESDVRSALRAVMPFFTVAGDDIFSPELDAYRAHLEEIKKAKIEGGKRGAAVTNKKRRKPRDAHQ